MLLFLIVFLGLAACQVIVAPVDASVPQAARPAPTTAPTTATVTANAIPAVALVARPRSMNHQMAHRAAAIETTADEGARATAPIMSAGALRALFRTRLGEHTLLVASASDAALRGRTTEFTAAVTALDENAVALAEAIGVVYGTAAAEAFLPHWRAHLDFLIDYITAVTSGDQRKQQQALAALDQSALDFGAFLQAANPNLTQATVAERLRTHIATLLTIIDAQMTVTPQASGDQQAAYPAVRQAYAHMDMHATALAAGISRQFPGLLTGKVDSAAADLRAALNGLLAEHLYLLAKSAAAALDARNIEFEAAAGALDQNSQDLAAVIGAIYGETTGRAFLSLWRKHIGFLMAYTLGLVEADPEAQANASAALTAYAQELGAFLHNANPKLPTAAGASLVSTHITMTLAVIDGAAADPQIFYTNMRAAYAHMALLANPLTDAIIAQFPEQFDEISREEQKTDGRIGHGAAETMATETVTASATVVINTLAFTPSRLAIPVGTTVVWQNQDEIGHTITAGNPEAKSDRFASKLFNQGEEYTVTFTETGEFPYFCQRHPTMRGLIVVVPGE